MEQEELMEVAAMVAEEVCMEEEIQMHNNLLACNNVALMEVIQWFQMKVK